MAKGTLLLLPNLLNKEADPALFMPPALGGLVQSLDGLFAEDAKEGRAYLKRLGADFRETPILLLNEHTKDLGELFAPLEKGERWGLISDAGLPLLADPGSDFVSQARNRGVVIEAYPGPSSLILALMLSGLSGQRFAFHGYLPKNSEERLVELEARSKNEGSTQLFIEAPYRNQKMLETLLQTLSDRTLLCIAWDLTFPTQGVEMRSIGQWKKRDLPNLHKRPAIFLFNAGYIVVPVEWHPSALST